jgi:hypothetical protein
MTNESKDFKTNGITDGALTEKWQHRAGRAAVLATARRELDLVRMRELRRAGRASKRDAVARGATTFVGAPCKFHPANAVRYTASHHCVICSRERADLKRRRAGTYGRRGQRLPRPPRRGR